jgi:hypothetical protein
MTRTRKLTGSRYQLGKERFDELQALSDALYGNPPLVRLMRQAVDEFIKQRIADRAVRERYDAALKARRGMEGDNVVILPKEK